GVCPAASDARLSPRVPRRPRPHFDRDQRPATRRRHRRAACPRIVVQFVGQIGGVILLRRRAPGMVRPFRIWLYPLPVVVGLAGWLFIFATTGVSIVLFGIGVLALGVLCFLGWSARTRQWPFAVPPLSAP